MLWKSCLGKSDKNLPPPPSPKQAPICSHRNSDPGGNSPLPEQRKIKSPNPSLENPKGGESCTLELSFTDQIWEFFLLGCEEHFARGRECLFKPLYPLIPWKVRSRGKEKPSSDLSGSKFPSSQQGGTGIALGRFCWQAEGAAPPPPPPPSASPGQVGLQEGSGRA